MAQNDDQRLAHALICSHEGAAEQWLNAQHIEEARRHDGSFYLRRLIRAGKVEDGISVDEAFQMIEDVVLRAIIEKVRWRNVRLIADGKCSERAHQAVGVLE